MARYYRIDYEAQAKALTWEEAGPKKAKARLLDGGYVLTTDRRDLTEDEVWRLYTLLTQIESAFRSMKSPLMERLIFHQFERRVQTHIFLCLLAYHLPVAFENASPERTPRGPRCARRPPPARWSPWSFRPTTAG